ncbi:hypothetical protein EDD17DRAFT_1662575 [Pisolithus thermaeus]|nr:hypothetical protein EDD17DRAFT_1662575 [Pisolithus thermaeus]
MKFVGGLFAVPSPTAAYQLYILWDAYFWENPLEVNRLLLRSAVQRLLFPRWSHACTCTLLASPQSTLQASSPMVDCPCLLNSGMPGQLRRLKAHSSDRGENPRLPEHTCSSRARLTQFLSFPEIAYYHDSLARPKGPRSGICRHSRLWIGTKWEAYIPHLTCQVCVPRRDT